MNTETRELLTNFFEYLLNRGYKGKTIEDNKYNLKQFFQRIEKEKGHKATIEDIQLLDINRFVSFLKELSLPKLSRYYGKQQGLSSRTIAHKITKIKMFFKFCNIYYNRGISFQHIEIPKSTRRDPVFLTEEEVDLLLECPEKLEIREDIAKRNYLFIYLAYTTGMRMSELLNISIRDIVGSDQILVRGKGDKTRIIYINKECQKLIKEFIPYRKAEKQISPRTGKPYHIRYKTDFLFVSMNDATRGHPMSKATRCGVFKRYSQYLNLGKDITCHALRHSFGTTMVKKDIHMRKIQKLMGHSRITTTQGYTHLVNSDLHEAHKKVFG